MCGIWVRLVAEGEQDQAEVMLKSNPNLALVPGDVTDLSKRTFTRITGFQYAVIDDSYNSLLATVINT